MRPLVQPTFAPPAPDLLALDEPLFVHRRTAAAENDSLVVFVHGLGGSRYGDRATWGDFPRLLDEDLPEMDVGLYGYTTLFGRLRFWRSVDLEVEAQVLAHQIRDHLPYRTIVLAGHSMGGLLCMAAIAYLADFAAEALERIGGLILMATPQFGSQRTPRGLGWLSRDFQALKPHGRFVTDLQATFAHRLALTETSHEPGRKAIPTWVLAGSSDLWVDRLSAVATLPPARVSLVRGSHTSIVKPRDREADAYRRVRGWIEGCLARAVEPEEGRGDGGTGDRRFAGRFVFREKEYVHVPAGPFTMGSTETRVRNLNEADGSEIFSHELPAHKVDLPGFYIARYPVTQADYAAFVVATGHAAPFRDDELSREYNWDRERRTPPAGKADHPVVLVSWFDAQAYCRWLSGQLPTEAEWEKAARGTDQREWPWGSFWQTRRCNSAEAELGGTTPVGSFSPAGDSPYGVGDMAGNAWEWCSNLFAPYPYDAHDGREDPATEGHRVIRGGACGLDRRKVRCGFRKQRSPAVHGFTIGFRVVFDRPPEGSLSSPS